MMPNSACQDCFTIENFLEPDECDKIIALFKDPQQGKVIIEGKAKNHEIRDCNIVWIKKTHENDWIFESAVLLISQLNRAYWNLNLQHITEIQLTEYQVGGHYDWHTDNSALPDRQITMVVQLSEESSYEHGELLIKPDVTASKKRGSAIAFPSHLVHKVVPVTKGKRISLVVWASS